MNLDDAAFLRDLGERIRARRAARGLTQAQLAEICALHRTFIGSVERGERNVSILNVRMMARALRVPLAVLFESLDEHRSRTSGDAARGRESSR